MTAVAQRETKGFIDGYIYRDQWVVWENVGCGEISAPEFRPWEDQELGCFATCDHSTCITFAGTEGGRVEAETYYAERVKLYDRIRE